MQPNSKFKEKSQKFIEKISKMYGHRLCMVCFFFHNGKVTTTFAKNIY